MEGPRLRGIREHLERAQFLFDTAQGESDPKAVFRLMLAAVYSCRAITELMLEAAGKQEVNSPDDPTVKLTRTELEALVSAKLPFYALIERIRIHDFHRFGLVPPDPTKRELMLGGTVKLLAQGGGAAYAIASNGPHTSVTGPSKVQPQRPLLVDDGLFFDDESSKYVTLSAVVEQFLVKAGDVISEFADNLV
jgi:hypothetical protein